MKYRSWKVWWTRARARLNRAETLAELDDEGLGKRTRRIVGKEKRTIATIQPYLILNFRDRDNNYFARNSIDSLEDAIKEKITVDIPRLKFVRTPILRYMR